MTIRGLLRTVIILCGFTTMTALAGGAFEAGLGTDFAKVLKDVDISMMNGDNGGMDSGRGLVPYYKKLGKSPARVALVSFYVWDCGNKKEDSYRIYGGNYVYSGTNTTYRRVDAGEIDKLATELYSAGIEPLKESFAAAGMQLLTPDQYLDTPAKQQAYDTFKMETGAINSLLRGLQAHNADNKWQWGTPAGYRVMELVTVGDVKGNHFQLGQTGIGIGKTANALGHDLAGALNVDAVVILYNVVQAEKKAINMRGAGLYMFGPNPIADTGQSMYYPGQEYSGVYLRLKDIPFITLDKKGDGVAADYDGYAMVAKALGTRMAEHLQKKFQ
jgi:hypothetical protein